MKIRRGRSFKKLLSYLLDHDEAQIIMSTISDGSINEMTREFAALAETRLDIDKPVWHSALRLPAGEHLTDEKWSAITLDYMKMIGFSETAQYVSIKHDKNDGEHIHIEANRIGGAPGGGVYLGKNENLKSTRIIAELEKKYGLRITKSADFDNDKVVMPDRSSLSKNELEKALRTGEAPARLLLQQVIDEALTDHPDLHDFTERLFIAGVTVKPNIASTGRVNGLAFNLDGISFSGSKIGKKYSWNQLQKQIDYNPDRDSHLLKNLKEAAQKNDEIRASQKASRHSISANAETSKDSERTSISDARHHKQTQQSIISTQSRRANADAESTQDKPKNQQIKRADSSYFSASSRNHYNSLIHVTKKGFNMKNVIEMKRKKRHQQQEEELLIITGKKRVNVNLEKFAEEQKKFHKTLELAFEKRENSWYSKHNGKLAFTEMDDKIVGGEGLMNKDGTYNEAAMRAMKQAAQLKFGDTFESIGSAEYVRESWFSTAKIGCFNTGYEPKPDDFDRLIDELKKHEEKYGKPLYLHPRISKQLNDHKRQLENTKRHLKTASGGNSDAEIKTEQERLLNQKQAATVNIGAMVDRFRNKQEHSNNHENQSKRGF